MMTEFTLADLTVGDNVQAFHPAMFGVVLYGRVTKVGTKYVHVDFGPIRGGVFRMAPNGIVENWGEG
jgi:hypothetical protein